MHKKSSTQSQRSDASQRLVVWGERREEPDWDTYIAALLSFALRKVEAENEAAAEDGDGR